LKLQAEIERLEARTVDAEVVRGNFAVFSRVFEHLTPEERLPAAPACVCPHADRPDRKSWA
jgi:hypothetical protein